MKEIIALQQYTDKYVSLYEGEIRNISDGIADELINKGIVEQHTDSDSSSNHNSDYSLEKIENTILDLTFTSEEINDQGDIYNEYTIEEQIQNYFQNSNIAILKENNEINVIFDNIEYQNVPIIFEEQSNYCSIGYTEGNSLYPFEVYFIFIVNNNEIASIVINTEQAGEHTIVIQQKEDKITTSQDFQTIIKSITSPFIIKTTSKTDAPGETLDKTWKEIHDAFLSGRQCILQRAGVGNNTEQICSLTYVDNYVENNEEYYSVVFIIKSALSTYIAESANSYPEIYF